MPQFVNKTFDNADILLKYTPNSSWIPTVRNSNQSFKNFTETIGKLASSPQDQNVSFTFPENAIAFYYYGGSSEHYRLFALCIDCDEPINAKAANFEEVNRTTLDWQDRFGNAETYLLYSRRFDEPGVHTIVLRPSTNVLEPEIRYHNIISVARFELEVHANTTKPSSSLGATKQGRNIAKIVGGAIGGFVAVLCILILWFLHYRSRRRVRHQNRLHPFSPRAPAMLQSRVGHGLPGSTRISIIITGGKWIGRHVIPAAFWETERSQRGRYEIDAGPVNFEVRDPREIMPPQYEQIFRDRARSEERESSRGAEVHENRGKRS